MHHLELAIARAMQHAICVTALGMALLGMRDAVAASVEVFTVSTVPVSAPNSVRVHVLDGLTLVKQRLSAGLPNRPEAATELLEARVKTEGVALRRQVLAAVESMQRARALKIDRVPAVVIDGKYIVYGLPSVQESLARYSVFMAQGADR